MKIGVKQFLSSKKEFSAWHRGIYDGLRVHSPKKLTKMLMARKLAFNEYEESEGHYHDMAMMISYTLKWIGYGFFGYISGKLGGVV